jgi:tRNA pseudouridine synthase B (EC 4.2.1.70)
MRRTRADRRAVDGILLLDKPQGLTSNAALQQVKRLYNAAKAGHTGSLDPIATGMLPICFGGATRVSGHLLEADKSYRAVARLGVRTSTGDSEGEVIATSAPATLQRSDLEAVLEQFRGRQMQIPPMYSAIKHQGQALYRLARQGLEVERKAREVTIHSLQLNAFDAEGFEIEMRCSKGTYVRTLVEDIAAAVGQCAHLVALRRTELGGFDASRMVSLDALAALDSERARDALLLPVATAVTDWPQVVADPARTFYLSRGQAVHFAEAPEQGRVAVLDRDGQVLALAEIDDEGRVAPRRWLAG